MSEEKQAAIKVAFFQVAFFQAKQVTICLNVLS
jgi:hypothetical protein